MTHPADTAAHHVPPTQTSAVKALGKSALYWIATLIVLPVLVSYWIRACLLGKDRALEGSSQLLSLWPGMTGVYVRRAFLTRVLARCDRSVEVSFGTIFSQTAAVLEANVYIGPGCHLGWVHLEKDVLVAAGVHIPSGGQTHFFADPTLPIREQGGERRVVRIGEGSWIGSGAIVMADVGKGTVVAAGAVVTKPLPDYVIAGGVPAKVIRGRFETSEVL